MKTFKYLIATLILIAGGLSACNDDNAPTINTPALPDNSSTAAISTGNRVIYEVNLRNYSAEGNFAGLQKDLPRLKALGADILWLMPIHPIGEENREGSLGSPYAVKDYKAVNPDFGTLADLKALVAAAHEKGMEIWLDWVANHTAWDHIWVKDHLAYYAEQDGKRPYSPNGWNDVVQLDYNNREMRAAMIDAMKYWVQEADIDGYRCDAATYMPRDFWREARAEVDKIKKISWLEEGDVASYIAEFDCDYAWGFNTQLNEFGDNGDVTALKLACVKLYNDKNYADKQKMVYLTNHDLNAYDGTEFARYGSKLLPLTVLYFTIYDMPLIYNGQEIGYNKQMSLFDNDKINWNNENKDVSDLIHRLSYLKRTTPALESGAGRGTLYNYATNNDRVYAYIRKKGNSEVVVMLNFSNKRVDAEIIGNKPVGTFTNYLKGGSVQFETGTSIPLPANGYAIFVK